MSENHDAAADAGRDEELQKELARTTEPKVPNPFNHSQPETARTYSLGTSRVRLGINPNEREEIKTIRARTAELIDMIHDMRKKYGDSATNEGTRLCNIAMEKYEESAMWAIKAATINR